MHFQDVKLQCGNSSMLDYFGNSMDDASDCLWEAAKASHIIWLTDMEGDRLKWRDTSKITR